MVRSAFDRSGPMASLAEMVADKGSEAIGHSESVVESGTDMVIEVFMSLRYELLFTGVFCISWLMIQFLKSTPKRAQKCVARHYEEDDFVEQKKKAAGDEKRQKEQLPPNKQQKEHLPPSPCQSNSTTSPTLPWQSPKRKQAKPSSEEVRRLAVQSPVRLAEKICGLCAQQHSQALELLQDLAKEPGALRKVPPAVREQMWSALLLTSVRVGKPQMVLTLLGEAKAALGPKEISPDVFSSLAKMLTAKHQFKTCLQSYEVCKEALNGEEAVVGRAVWSCLLFCAVEAGELARCDFYFKELRRAGTPGMKDYGNMIRVAACGGDWERAVRLLEQCRADGMEPDNVVYNSALAVCVAAGQMNRAEKLLEEMEAAPGCNKKNGLTDVISYNTMMKGYMRANMLERCFQLHEDMSQRGIEASQVTYGILLDACINEHAMERAVGVFEQMLKDGVPMNTVLYTTLIKGFVRVNKVDKAMEIFAQMNREKDIRPDMVTYGTLIKANCDAGDMEASLRLVDDMAQRGFRPDEIVYNNLLMGCVRRTSPELARKFFDDMIQRGVRPSNATASIMIKVYAKARQLDEAAELVEKMPQEYKVEPEPRLFVQLIQACIRERQGRKAAEVYMVMCRKSPQGVSEASHRSLLGACATFNMFDTALQLLDLALEEKWTKSSLNAADANALLDAALRKRKEQIARQVHELMLAKGVPVEPRLASMLSAKTGPAANTPQKKPVEAAPETFVA